MRKLILTLLIYCFVISCKNNKTVNQENIIELDSTEVNSGQGIVIEIDSTEAISDQEIDSTEVNSDKPKFVEPKNFNKNYKTKTGKAFVLKETHPNGKSLSTIVLSTKGFAASEKIILTNISPIENVLVADINNDGFDELYIITKSASSGSYLNLYGYASNNDIVVSKIHIPKILKSDLALNGLFEGYMGHDDFNFKEDKIVRRFPVYYQDDINDNSSRENKEIIYLLKHENNSWALEIDESITETTTLIRDCSGTYIRLNEKDYKICNSKKLKEIDDGAIVNLTFIKVDNCDVTKDDVICMMHHPNEGWVFVNKIN